MSFFFFPHFCFIVGVNYQTKMVPDTRHTIDDNFDGTGDIFGIGTTIVTYNIVDMHGNAASCTTTVKITDNEQPTIVCPPAQTGTTIQGTHYYDFDPLRPVPRPPCMPCMAPFFAYKALHNKDTLHIFRII